MTRSLASVVLAVALLLAGCGGEAAADGDRSATLWVTRDRGASVLVDTRVAAGQTAMQALDRETEIETRYGGRFVQAIDGIEGSLARRVDWFWFVNGYEADRSAAEYRLRPGDVVWFDYRSWARETRVPVVVGAFPEPFLHGFGGDTRPTVVLYAGDELAASARRLGRLLRARDVRALGAGDVAADTHVVKVTGDGGRTVRARLRGGSGAPGGPVELTVDADLDRLVGDPTYLRFRYEDAP